MIKTTRTSWVVVHVDPSNHEPDEPTSERFPASVHWMIGTKRKPITLSSDGAYDVHNLENARDAKRIAYEVLVGSMENLGLGGRNPNHCAEYGFLCWEGRIITAIKARGALDTERAGSWHGGGEYIVVRRPWTITPLSPAERKRVEWMARA